MHINAQWRVATREFVTRSLAYRAHANVAIESGRDSQTNEPKLKSKTKRPTPMGPALCYLFAGA